jgi:DNA-binding NtrC family response regulator
MSAVLIIDDDQDVLKAARLALRGDFDQVDIAQAFDADLLGPADAVLLDMNFVAGVQTGDAGLNHLKAIRARDPTLAVVLMTTYGGVNLAVEGLKAGAVNFILKPWRNEALVSAAVEAVQRTVAFRAERDLDLAGRERRILQDAVARFGGNLNQAATALGLTRFALYRRLTKHGL